MSIVNCHRSIIPLVEIHKKIEDLNVTLLGLDTEKLGALEKIGGKLSLNCTAEYLKLPAGLKNLKVFVVSKGIERLDIQGIEIEELRFSGTGLENTTVIGDDIFKGKISLDNLSGYFPKLEGFREVGKLNIGYLGLNGGSIEIGNIRKINGDFSYWANSNVKAVEFPALEEVTGNFELYSNIKEYHFPELKSIGGKAIISIDYYDEKTFPNLATVGEDMMFQTGYDYYGSRRPAVVLYPALKQVGGTLELRPIGPTPWGDNENTGYLNQTLENLDFLSSLEKVGGIRIHDHGKLASYEAIKKAILTCPEEKWSVENNLYNPTYKQLVEDQQWIKPAIQE